MISRRCLIAVVDFNDVVRIVLRGLHEKSDTHADLIPSGASERFRCGVHHAVDNDFDVVSGVREDFEYVCACDFR